MIDKIREEFERTNARDHRRQPPKGNNYIDPMAQADWESYQKGWQAACESFVVQMPDAHSYTVPDVAGAAILDCMTAIRKAGGKAKL